MATIITDHHRSLLPELRCAIVHGLLLTHAGTALRLFTAYWFTAYWFTAYLFTAYLFTAYWFTAYWFTAYWFTAYWFPWITPIRKSERHLGG